MAKELSFMEKFTEIRDFITGAKKIRNEYEKKLKAQSENHAKEVQKLKSELADQRKAVDDLYETLNQE